MTVANSAITGNQALGGVGPSRVRRCVRRRDVPAGRG